jgi:hypothetical protein
MKIIQRIELTGSQALIELTSIPQTFTDLVLLFSGRSARSADFEEYRIYFNGVNTNLSTRYLEGNGGSASTSTTANGFIGIGNSSTSTANTFGSTYVYIPNYAGSTAKDYLADNISETNGTTGYQEIVAGLWNQTAAITSITLTNGTGSNWLAGTSATLYGITKGSDNIVVVS